MLAEDVCTSQKGVLEVLKKNDVKTLSECFAADIEMLYSCVSLFTWTYKVALPDGHTHGNYHSTGHCERSRISARITKRMRGGRSGISYQAILRASRTKFKDIEINLMKPGTLPGLS